MLFASVWGLVKREPVRVASLVIACVVIVVSLLSGVPLAGLLAQLAGYAAALEAVRRIVTPVVKLAAPDHAAEIDQALDMVRDTAAALPAAVDEVKEKADEVVSAVKTASVSQGVGKVG